MGVGFAGEDVSGGDGGRDEDVGGGGFCCYVLGVWIVHVACVRL